MQEQIEAIKKLINADYLQKIKAFETLVGEQSTIFIGDSMIAYFNLNRYGFKNAFNMGIAGDTTTGVMKRLHLLKRLKPKRVILSIGSNDLVLTDHDVLTIIDNIIKIKHTIDQESRCYVLLLTPINTMDPNANMRYIAGRTNQDIMKINDGIKYVLKHDVIDTHTPLIDNQKQLKIAYSKDGIHLSDAGYEQFKNTINHYLKAST